MKKRNTINGQPLEFGNTEQIQWLKDVELKMLGKRSICEVDWEFVRISNRTTETRNPITYYADPKKSNGVQCYIPCPRCSRVHHHVVSYDPYEIDQTAEWYNIESQEIICWNCGLEMFIEQDGSRNVFVKQTTEPA